MGSCCTSGSHDQFYEQGRHSAVPPRTVLMSGSSILACLDISPTPESSRLKTALKGTFGHAVAFNNERSLLDQIGSTVGHKYYIVIIGKISSHGLKSLAQDSKVVAIYLCLGQPRYEKIPDSSKVKGFYQTRADLEAAIYHDM